jgi:lysozyme family protein
MTTFDAAFHKLLGHEGSFVDHPADPGGATNWGVTERVARANGYTGPMQLLPVDVAKAIYRKDYWAPIRAEELPEAIRYAVFDAAVNSGNAQAIRWLQRAVGARDDGVIGPQTLLAVKSRPADVVLRRMLAMRLRFMTDLKNWPSFSRGWARRIADLMEAA